MSGVFRHGVVDCGGLVVELPAPGPELPAPSCHGAGASRLLRKQYGDCEKSKKEKM